VVAVWSQHSARWLLSATAPTFFLRPSLKIDNNRIVSAINKLVCGMIEECCLRCEARTYIDPRRKQRYRGSPRGSSTSQSLAIEINGPCEIDHNCFSGRDDRDTPFLCRCPNAGCRVHGGCRRRIFWMSLKAIVKPLTYSSPTLMWQFHFAATWRSRYTRPFNYSIGPSQLGDQLPKSFKPRDVHSGGTGEPVWVARSVRRAFCYLDRSTAGWHEEATYFSCKLVRSFHGTQVPNLS
jgi:hypothetical protein